MWVTCTHAHNRRPRWMYIVMMKHENHHDHIVCVIINKYNLKNTLQGRNYHFNKYNVCIGNILIKLYI